MYQVLIIVLLSAVITGSLLVGKSVKESLKSSAAEHLGNTGIVISSGTRYFNSDLARKLSDSAGIACAGILEITGYSQNLNSQKGAFNTHIYGVGKDFFVFQGSDTLNIKPGEVAVNRKLSEYLGISTGDELIIRFTEIKDIPADAPFAPSESGGISKVLTVGRILEPSGTGNFSLSISQLTPMNIFMNFEDIEEAGKNGSHRNNRILVKNEGSTPAEISDALKSHLAPSDIGLYTRYIDKTSEIEMTSGRIFIDQEIVNHVTGIFPGSAPLLTYLANRITSDNKSTPYSFVSALPQSLYSDVADGNGMIINQWMAADLAVTAGDTVKMFWYSPDSLNNLVEKSGDFIVKSIAEMKGVWADSLLMPEFPGIAGKESCSDWDAGVPVEMDEIRQQDEDYWNKYRGTPKAFISYEKGREIWGNNFGPATSVRFPAGTSENQISGGFKGSLDPEKTGFIVTDLAHDSVSAAENGVDFGTLFLSLGFFLIVASMVLLSFAASSYFDSKKRDIKTLYALGFRNRWIFNSLISETGIISLAGSVTGAFGGYLINIIITGALNTVWSGAVQTNTLHAYFDFSTIIIGFLISFLTIMILMLIKSIRFLKSLNRKKQEINKTHSVRVNSVILTVSVLASVTLVFLSLTSRQNLTWSYPAGVALLLTMIFAWRQYFISGRSGDLISRSQRTISHHYYSFYPSNAVMPVLFIAAGIFTVFITSANRMSFTDKTERSGGTGGYLLWCENTIPVKEDLKTESGRISLGLDELSGINFVQFKRSQGNDASCLNLNHITVPPILGVDPSDFIEDRSFSFSKSLESKDIPNPWQYLKVPSENNTIYGIADQTVLDWGMKIKVGDTLIIRAENGSPLNIIIAAGLQSSVFQGNILIGMENFTNYYPTVSGTSVILIGGEKSQIDLYKSTLNDRLVNYGVNVEKTTDRLAAFYNVTNTYLSVFSVFGALGMIIGIIGLGFVLLRNYTQRKQEFALMLATGFQIKRIRGMIFSEQLLIILAGTSGGIVSAIIATLPSLRNNAEVPWIFMIIVVATIVLTGIIALLVSVRSVTSQSLTAGLKKE
jgi:ABC-type antimicrobial peptide transport system permease subunit